MAIIWNLGRVAPAAVALVFVSVAAPALAQQATKPTVVTLERVSGHVVYKVDSRRVGDLLSAFNGVASREGASHLVTVLIDSSFPISEIWNVDGVAGKAQLTNVRFFVVFRETDLMSEIRRMPAIRVGAPIE